MERGLDITKVIDHRYAAAMVARDLDVDTEDVGKLIGLRVKELKAKNPDAAFEFAGEALAEHEDVQLRATMEERTWMQLAIYDLYREYDVPMRMYSTNKVYWSEEADDWMEGGYVTEVPK